MLPLRSISPLFPYTTLFRSGACRRRAAGDRLVGCVRDDRVAAPRHTARAPDSHLLPLHEIGRDTSELQSPYDLVCRLLLEKKKATRCPSTLRTSPLRCSSSL